MTSKPSSIQPRWAAKSVCHCWRLISLRQLSNQFLLLQVEFAGVLKSDLFEGDGGAGAELADVVMIDGGDAGDLRIAAGGLLVDEEEDGLARVGDLDGAQADAGGEDFTGERK